MKYAVAFMFSMIFLVACVKKVNYQAEGTLTGVDMTLCGCCGDVVLVMDNNPGPYRVDSIRFMSKQDLWNLDFPLRIKFDYETRSSCGIEHLLVTEYAIQQ